MRIKKQQAEQDGAEQPLTRCLSFDVRQKNISNESQNQMPQLWNRNVQPDYDVGVEANVVHYTYFNHWISSVNENDLL